jgi:uncharacterized membrane protein YphA (DoxX/SURF4 family)
MKIPEKIKTVLKVTITYLFAFLFTYAAVSKILDYHDFSIKLGQSPLFSAFAGWVAIGVPVVELLIVVMLCFPRWRFMGLFASFCLMVTFTAYIVIILNFSSYVPCSCGGILQDMGWTEHLIFNIAFVILALIGLLLSDAKENHWLAGLNSLRFYFIITFAAIVSILAVVILYLLSEDIIHNRNTFIRRFDAHAQVEYNKYDLGLNSYYFAGVDHDTIYLGNVTTPLFLTRIDTAFKSRNRTKIELDQPDLAFHDIHIKVSPPYFFVTDGTVPAIFLGKVKDWKAFNQKGEVPFFTLADPIDSTNIAMRLTSLIKKQNTLAVYSLSKGKLVSQNTTILEKQIDGIFDTDGMLISNDRLKRVHYIYYYRNQFLTANIKMQQINKGKTIDTVSKAEIKVAELSAGERQMSKPPLIINKASAVYGNLLFIKSKRIGRFEDEKMLKDTSILDVYNLNDGSYISSMYLYHINGMEMTSFKVVENKIYAISGRYLSVIKLPEKIADTYSVK